jgi:histone deacetylase 1/2
MWQDAMNAEYQALMKNNKWSVVRRPEDRKVIDSRWVFKRKRDQNNKIVKYKARFVARGFTQVYGYDYTETYSPVAHSNSIRTILSITASEDLELFQMDIETAFQHQVLKEDVYMEQPAGFIKPGTTAESHVCKLQKALYGLKQARR